MKKCPICKSYLRKDHEKNKDDSNVYSIPIEFHYMFSLGLYGFNNYSILPQKFSRWHYWWLRQQGL